jgi:hypothetical protein
LITALGAANETKIAFFTYLNGTSCRYFVVPCHIFRHIDQIKAPRAANMTIVRDLTVVAAPVAVIENSMAL